MKLIQLFGKSPKYRRFSYDPRFYNPGEEERIERENRIRKELENEKKPEMSPEELENFGHRERMSGSFREAKRMAARTGATRPDSSANILRLIILMVITLGLIGYIQYGQVALYVVMGAIVPLYLYLKFRPLRK